MYSLRHIQPTPRLGHRNYVDLRNSGAPSVILNPNDCVRRPCLESGVDLTEKRGRDPGINGFWSRPVGETSPRTIATPTAVGTGPHQDDLTSLGPHKDDLASLGPHKDDLASLGPHKDDLASLGPHKDDLASLGPDIVIWSWDNAADTRSRAQRRENAQAPDS